MAATALSQPSPDSRMSPGEIIGRLHEAAEAFVEEETISPPPWPRWHDRYLEVLNGLAQDIIRRQHDKPRVELKL